MAHNDLEILRRHHPRTIFKLYEDVLSYPSRRVSEKAVLTSAKLVVLGLITGQYVEK